MTAKYHINSNGDVMLCKATKNRCQFGDGSLHFEDANEARKFVEKIYSESDFRGVLLGKKSTASELLERKAPAVQMNPLKKSLTYAQEIAAAKKAIEIELDEFTEDDLAWGKRLFRKPKAETLTIKGEKYKILTDRSKSAFLCTDCGKQLTLKAQGEILSYMSTKCSCGADTLPNKDQPIGVFAESLWILEPEKHPEKELYHITKREHWDYEIRRTPDLRIHLGTLSSAEHRMEDLKLHGEKGPWSRYSVRLKKPAEVKVLLSDDLEDSWDRISDDGEFVAYINRWESPGDLSLMTIQKNMVIEKVKSY